MGRHLLLVVCIGNHSYGNLGVQALIFRDIDSISIAANRQRRDFDLGALNELAESIQSKGLMHPIVVRNGPDGPILVAGERRLRAIRDIWALGGSFTYNSTPCPAPQVPIVTLGELSPLAAEEAELEENTRRSDLTWQERAHANSRLASLRTNQARAAGNPDPSVGDLSLEVRGSSDGRYKETTRRELIVARHLADPDIRSAKNVDDAFKILVRREEGERNTARAEAFGKSYSAASHKAIQADALEWLVAAEAEQFDVILTDPPYGMGADEFGDSGGKVVGGHGYKDDAATFMRIVETCADHFYRICKPQAHLYIFCDIDNFAVWRSHLATDGWWVHRTPIIWHKPNGPRVPWPEHGPQRKWEMLLYAVKGKKNAITIKPDLVSFAADENLGPAAQKPVALFTDLLRRSVRPGDSVLDPFAGTGTIFPAAHELKCYATGVEIDSASYGIGLRRLEALK